MQALQVVLLEPLVITEAQEMQTHWHLLDFVRQVQAEAVEAHRLEQTEVQVAQVDSLLLAEQVDELLVLHLDHLAQVVPELLESL